MKKILISLAAASLALTARATSYTFSTTSLNSLAHGTAYTWGLSGSTFTALANALHSGQHLTGATLTVTHLDDWTVEPKDVLYVNLLNWVGTGIHSYTYNSNPSTYDTSYGPDFFASTSTHLAFGAAQANSLLVYTGSYDNRPNPGTWSDPDTAGVTTNFNMVIDFTSANLSLLSSFFSADWNTTHDLGLGFSPDCHYYDTGVTLCITTAKAPDAAATLSLLGLSFMALAGLRRILR